MSDSSTMQTANDVENLLNKHDYNALVVGVGVDTMKRYQDGKAEPVSMTLTIELKL